MKNLKIAAIIPFYQKEKGILIKALMSVLGQKNAEVSEIIVVDDGSPVSAEDELAILKERENLPIKLIYQKNSGPGAARNAGLDNLSSGMQYVAFLDSDDVWDECHIENAIFALRKGYDIYFANYKHFKHESDFRSRLEPYDHLLIDEKRRLFEYRGNMITTLLHANPIPTSTFVYRFEAYPDLRFRSEFFNGQDYIFWLEFSLLTSKIVFSERIDCVYGKGVNIWDDAGWGRPRALDLASNNMKLIKFIYKNIKLNSEQKNYVKKKISYNRRNFVASLLHDISHGKRVELTALAKQYRIDAMTYVYFIPNLLKILVSKIVRKVEG
jgi:succinoglycan biosynthesis protein ExoW